MLGTGMFQGPGLYIFRTHISEGGGGGAGNQYFHLVPQEALVARLENKLGLEGVQHHGQNRAAASAVSLGLAAAGHSSSACRGQGLTHTWSTPDGGQMTPVALTPMCHSPRFSFRSGFQGRPWAYCGGQLSLCMGKGLVVSISSTSFICCK